MTSRPAPLFPLQTVLFPGGLLSLKVFEARYLDLVGRCLREQQPFGVVCLRQGHEVRRDAGDRCASSRTACWRELEDVDAEQAGILRVRCLGTQRFEIDERSHQQADGLWLADAHCCSTTTTPSRRRRR